MRIRVLFFGVLKDIVGCREESVEIPEGGRVETVFELYANRFPRLREVAASTVLAVNQQFSTPTAPLSDGDEVAFLPPVSGGSGKYIQEIHDPEGHLFALTREPIDGTALAKKMLRGEDGAFVNFEGVTRNNTKGRQTQYLEYECYEGMAVKMMAEIGRDIASRYEIGRIAIVHRLGRLDVSETSVAVVVTSPHRRAAFEAALEGINRLKKLVPVWKKEYFVDGEVWVEGEWDESVARAQG
ncbi:MAG: molybdenum cofactor biosynthesis protein MoaE [Bryobacteraceae bacterium]